jgi:hypothetical protein
MNVCRRTNLVVKILLGSFGSKNGLWILRQERHRREQFSSLVNHPQPAPANLEITDISLPVRVNLSLRLKSLSRDPSSVEYFTCLHQATALSKG